MEDGQCSHLVNKCFFHGQFNAMFFTFLCLLLVILLFIIISSVGLNCCLLFQGKEGLDKFHSGMSHKTVVLSSINPKDN